MKRPTPKQALGARFNEFTICIKMLLDNNHTLPSLILIYSAVDVFASLTRPENQPDTDGNHFKNWAQTYMIVPSSLPITAEDLWGARCGLLHTHTPSSKNSRHGKAREIAYYRARNPTAQMQRTLDATLKVVQAKGKLPLNADALYGSLEEGIGPFIADIERDPALEKRVFQHCSKIFGVLNSFG